MPYKVGIYPSRKGTTTSANAWIVLSGTLGETQQIIVPKGSLHFEFRVRFKFNFAIYILNKENY